MKRRYLWMVKRAYRGMRHPRLRHRKWWQALIKPMKDKRLWRPCRDTVAKGLAIGLLVFMLPIPQSLVAGVLAAWARANVPIAIAATWISNPLTGIALLPLQAWLGKTILAYFDLASQELTGEAVGWGMKIKHFVANGALGGAVIGIVLASLAFGLTHLFSYLMPHRLPRRNVRVVSPVAPKSSAS
jgi:uncharacterized protein (DUF2062 family)